MYVCIYIYIYKSLCDVEYFAYYVYPQNGFLIFEKLMINHRIVGIFTAKWQSCFRNSVEKMGLSAFSLVTQRVVSRICIGGTLTWFSGAFLVPPDEVWNLLALPVFTDEVLLTERVWTLSIQSNETNQTFRFAAEATL